jgi:hypothetical protein
MAPLQCAGLLSLASACAAARRRAAKGPALALGLGCSRACSLVCGHEILSSHNVVGVRVCSRYSGGQSRHGGVAQRWSSLVRARPSRARAHNREFWVTVVTSLQGNVVRRPGKAMTAASSNLAARRHAHRQEDHEERRERERIGAAAAGSGLIARVI